MYLKPLSEVRAHYAAGNPLAMYPKWYNDQWPSIGGDLYAWATTGDTAALERLKTGYEIPYHGEAGLYRQDGLDALLGYALLKDHVGETKRAQLEADIKRMCTSALRHNRAGDADERRCHLMIWAVCDKWFDTSYLTANERTDKTSPYYVEWDSPQILLEVHNKEMAVDSIDGATAESTGYMINTQNKFLIGVILCGKDILPGLKEWLPKFREFLLWGVSYDCRHSHVYGDAQESLDIWYQWNLWYRLPLYWMMVAIDEDPDGQLAALALELAEWRAQDTPITSPSQLHPTLYWPWVLAADLDKVANPPSLELETGFKFFRPGFAIYRDKDTYFYFTGTSPMQDDHDAVAQGGSDYRLYHKGQLVINRPGGYLASWQNYNGSALKGHSWLRHRGTDVAELLPDGRVHVKYHQRGPMPSMLWQGPDDYVGHEWALELYFDPKTLGLTVEYSWKHDGVFPDPSLSQYYPQLQAYLPFETGFFAPAGNSLADSDGESVTWQNPDGRNMLVIATGEDVGVYVEAWELHGVRHFDWIRLKSTRHVGSHKLEWIVGSVGTLPPPPPPPVEELPEPVELAIVDQSSVGYSTTGGWITHVGQGVGGAVDYVEGGDGSFIARWKAKLKKGKCRVATIWEAYSNRATDSPFKVMLNGTGTVLEVVVNQELPPASFKDLDGVWWHELGIIDVPTEGAIAIVELNNKANDHVIADAVWFEHIDAVVPPPPPPDPELRLPMSFDGGRITIDRDVNGVIRLRTKEVFEQD